MEPPAVTPIVKVGLSFEVVNSNYVASLSTQLLSYSNGCIAINMLL